MSSTKSERRLAENEALLRDINEKILKGFRDLKKMGDEEDEAVESSKDNDVLFFFCECSDLDCESRVKMRPSRYAMIHKSRDKFVIASGHITPEVEVIDEHHSGYDVVCKTVTTAKTKQPVKK